MDVVRNENNQNAGLMDKVRNGATYQLGVQKDRVTEGVTSVTQAVRQSTQQLRDNQHETIAQYVEKAVDQVERFAERMKEKDANELLRDAQQFARRNPAVFVAAAFGVGIVAARFLKSSNRTAASSSGDWRERTSAGSYPSAAQNYRPGGTHMSPATSFSSGTDRF